ERLFIAERLLVAIGLAVAERLALGRIAVARRTRRAGCRLAEGACRLIVAIAARPARTLGFVFFRRAAVFVKTNAAGTTGTRSITTATGCAEILARTRRGGIGHLAVEIDTGSFGELLAELVLEHLGAHHFDGAFRQIAELERTIRNADQAVHLKAKRAEHVLDLAVLAFAQAEQEPDIAALGALERGFDRAVSNAFALDAVLEGVELGLGDMTIGAHAIAAQPASGRQLEHALEATIIGEQQEALGVDIEAADGHNAGEAFIEQSFENGLATFRVLLGGHE